MRDEPKLLARGFTWPEAPRWHDGALWISDVHNFRIARVDMDGAVETVARVEGRPSGMDFAADGSLLLATGLSKQLVRIDPAKGSVEPVPALGPMLRGLLNDLLTHAHGGWSWVGDTGFVFGADEPRRAGRLLAWHPDAGAKIVAEELFFPNGMAIAPDGAVLYLAETFGKCITAFDIAENGILENRRLHADLPGSPDGLCLDAEGCLWAPLLLEGAFVRISPRGEVLERIEAPGKSAISCVFGGENRATLFLCMAEVDRSDPDNVVRRGEVHVLTGRAGGAGRP